jgi:prolipoprotein diacylglyceryltransferase
MFPILFSIGNLSFKTINLFLLIGFLATGFMLWRRSKEEHYSELEVFDAFLLSFIFYLIVGRIVFVLLNFTEFRFDLIKWVDVISHRGNSQLAGLVGATFYLYRYSIKKRWDGFEILDFASQAITVGLMFFNLGYFFDGSMFGKITNLPWGVLIPGAFEKKHPVQLYFCIFFIVLSLILSWFEYHYRTFEWYRKGKKSAQSGFLFCTFLILLSGFSLLINLVSLPQVVINKFSLDIYIQSFGLFLGLVLLYFRSGRFASLMKDNRLWVKRN